MIEKVIENWLTEASEKSFQVPFAYMLIGEGHTIVHITRHCSMEFGKDIITKDHEGATHAYQLKGARNGRYGKSDYRDGLPQLNELVMIPVSHPSIERTKSHVPYLVVNGEIEEEVAAGIRMQNDDWVLKGYNPLNTIVKGQMFGMAMRIKDYLLPTELTDVRLMLEFYLNSGTGFLDKGKFARLIASVIPKNLETKAELRRRISSGALVCAIALENFIKKQNHISIIEGWTIYAATILGIAESGKLSFADIENELLLAQHQIEDSLIDLYNEVKNDNELLTGNRVLDANFYHHRVTILVGFIGELGRRATLNRELGIDLNELEGVLHKLWKQTELWGDSSIPYLITRYFFYLANGVRKEEHLIIPLEILTRLSSILQNPRLPFFDAYYSAEQSIVAWLDQRVSKSQFMGASSYSLMPLLMLSIDDFARPAVENLWKRITNSSFLQFNPPTTSDIFNWHNENGKNMEKMYDSEVSWKFLKEWASNPDELSIPKVFAFASNWIPLFFMVYPHRFTTDLALYFRNLTIRNALQKSE